MILINKPVLQIYKQDAETQLHTDASKYGYGAILLQKNDEDNQFHPVYLMSLKTTPAEEKYHSYELEVLAVIKAIKKFRVYLLGIKFKIISDCSAFKMTMSKKDLVTRVGRWALLLEEYDYEIEHRSGNRMGHVDALSRNPHIFMIQDCLFYRIKKAQEEDEYIQTIVKVLEKENNYQDFLLKSELLYKCVDGEEKLVIPKRMQNEIIKNTHENGHFSVKKVSDIIKKEFFIPKLDSKIEDCIRNCVKCILINRKQGRKEGFLNPIDKENCPLSTYHIDYLGPMTATSKQYKHIFTVTDGFSKFIWIYPTKSTTATEVLDRLKLQQKIFGNPKRIICDRGTCFTSNDFKKYCEDEKIEYHFITTGVARGNGQVERVHNTIIPVIAKISIDEPDKWYKHVDKVQRVVNSSVNRSIGRSPFEVMFGVKMRNVEEIKIKEILDEEIQNIFIDQRDELRRDAAKQIIKIQEENRKTYNKFRKEVRKYQIGDLVAIKRTQFGTGLKLHGEYLGPYSVINVKRNDRYDVEKIGQHEGPIRTCTSSDFMKIFVDKEESDGEFSSGEAV